MIKTYVYTGKSDTRVLLKRGQAKVTVKPNETFQTELDYKNSKYMTLVGAESIDKIAGKIKHAEKTKETLKQLESDEKKVAKAKYEEDLKKISAVYKIKQEKVDSDIDFLEVQRKAAFQGITEKIKQLEEQKAELDSEKKVYEEMQKDLPKKDKKNKDDSKKSK